MSKSLPVNLWNPNEVLDPEYAFTSDPATNSLLTMCHLLNQNLIRTQFNSSASP